MKDIVSEYLDELTDWIAGYMSLPISEKSVSVIGEMLEARKKIQEYLSELTEEQ